jgi:hypothetical protein
MREAKTILGIIHDRGRRGLPLERLYRLLFNRDLYLLAYGRLARNQGAMTPGATPETIDGMTVAKIDAIIAALRCERYRWTPVRRVYVAKKRSTKRRPSVFPPGPTSCCKRSSASSWKRTTSSSSVRPRTASGQDEGATPLWTRFTTGGSGPSGGWRET